MLLFLPIMLCCSAHKVYLCAHVKGLCLGIMDCFIRVYQSLIIFLATIMLDAFSYLLCWHKA